VSFDGTVDTHLVLKPTVGLRNNGRKTPGGTDFDLLDEVYAIRVFGCVEK
jgi:hypothetical protein